MAGRRKQKMGIVSTEGRTEKAEVCVATSTSGLAATLLPAAERAHLEKVRVLG